MYIFRVRDLLRSDVLTKKPVWYDVIAAFPPMTESDLQRQPEHGQVRRIVYPEDAIRRWVNENVIKVVVVSNY